jgi:hypothetical protein
LYYKFSKKKKRLTTVVVKPFPLLGLNPNQHHCVDVLLFLRFCHGTFIGATATMESFVELEFFASTQSYCAVSQNPSKKSCDRAGVKSIHINCHNKILLVLQNSFYVQMVKNNLLKL